MLGYRMEDDLPRISVPVIVIRGVRDPIARPPWVAALASRARCGRAVSVEGARHLVMHAQPHETADLIAGAAP
jgi:pimeloyl-ACP methyl ester carboxylesterase